MVDLLESREASQKIEAPQFSVDDRELPNYWILLKFYGAFRLKAQQTNCKYGSACTFGRKCGFKHSHCTTITNHDLTAEVHQPYRLDANILTKQDKADSGLSVCAHATAHTTTHQASKCAISRPSAAPQHNQVLQQPSQTSTAAESTAGQSQANPRDKVRQPQVSQDRANSNCQDTADGEWQTVTKRPRTRTLQDPQPQQGDQRCKDCQAPFRTSPDKIEWLINRGLNLPLRCDACIQQRKAKTANQSSRTPQISRQAEKPADSMREPLDHLRKSKMPTAKRVPSPPQTEYESQANSSES